jgi:hypothetical protein
MKIMKLINNLSRKKNAIGCCVLQAYKKNSEKNIFLNQNLSVNAIQTRLVIIKKQLICLLMSIKYIGLTLFVWFY